MSTQGAEAIGRLDPLIEAVLGICEDAVCDPCHGRPDQIGADRSATGCYGLLHLWLGGNRAQLAVGQRAGVDPLWFERYFRRLVYGHYLGA